jgi:hypothetical protein
MEALPLASTTGWASGINAYACVYFAFRAIRRGLARFRAWQERRSSQATGSSAV